MNQRYKVYDAKGTFATSYNLGLGKALALQLAKLSCDQMGGMVTLEDNTQPNERKVIYQKKPKR